MVRASEHETLQAYIEALLNHGDFATYLSDDVVAVIQGLEPQRLEGRDAVRGWIDSAHGLGRVEVHATYTGDGHAWAECEFVRKDGVRVPYGVSYDLDETHITALRLYFTGPVA